MTTGRLQAFNFQSWIKENQHLLKPPVGNKKVFEDGAMTVQVVGGPNERTDFHVDPVEEFFYQLKGAMVLKVVDSGQIYDVPIREGEVFLLPARVPHSRNGRRRARSAWWSRRRGRTRSTGSSGIASNAVRKCIGSRSRSSTWSGICRRSTTHSVRMSLRARARNAARFTRARSRRRAGSRFEFLHRLLVPRQAVAGAVGCERESIHDAQRLFDDRVRPIDIFQQMTRGLAASRCTLISGIKCDDISMRWVAASAGRAASSR